MRVGLISYAFALIAAFAPTIASAQIQVGSTSQVSLSTTGIAPQGGSADLPSFGPNARYLVFESNAFNLVSSDTNGGSDVFIRDLKSGAISLGSINSVGVQAAGHSNHGAVSAILPNGFYAYAFESDGQNLTTIPNLSVFRNIYVRIPSLAITEIVSPGRGFTAAVGDSTTPSIAAYPKGSGARLSVVFSSDANNLIASDSNFLRDIYLSEIPVPPTSSYVPADFSTITRIPKSFVSGTDPNGISSNPKISADGRYIVFESQANNLVNGLSINSTTQHIYRYDTLTDQTILISKAKNGTPGDADSSSPVVSYNGRYVAYTTSATNIVSAQPVDPFRIVVRYDTVKDVSEQVNLSSSGAQGDGQGTEVAMSANGRLLSFTDNSSNLLPVVDQNDAPDVFVKDMETGAISRVSVGPNGVEGSSSSSAPTISSSTYNNPTSSVAFESNADNLTSVQTSSGNGDVYLNSVTLPPPPLSNDSSLDVPPDVTVKAKKLTFTAQKFSTSLPSGAANLQLRYDFRLTVKTTTNGKSHTTKSAVIQKRNLLTVVKSKGQYTIKNRVLGINPSTGKATVKTGFTPRQTFTVN